MHTRFCDDDIWKRSCFPPCLPPVGGYGPHVRCMLGVVGGDSRVRLSSGRTDGNAKTNGGSPSAMRRPSHRSPPSLPKPPVPTWRASDGWRYAPVDNGCQEKNGGVVCCRKKRGDTVGEPLF